MRNTRFRAEEEVVAFSIRLPRLLNDRIRERAKQNRRSLNQEIVWLLEQALQFLDAEGAPKPDSAGERLSR